MKPPRGPFASPPERIAPNNVHLRDQILAVLLEAGEPLSTKDVENRLHHLIREDGEVTLRAGAFYGSRTYQMLARLAKRGEITRCPNPYDDSASAPALWLYDSVETEEQAMFENRWEILRADLESSEGA